MVEIMLNSGDSGDSGGSNHHSVWYQNASYTPETNVLHGGDILNHGGGLNHTTGVTVPFSIRSSTGGLHLAKAVVKRTATNAQLGYDYNIKLSTTSNQTVHQLFVLSTAAGTLGPTEGVFDQLIGAPTYGELLLQRTTTVLCRFEELDVGEATGSALPSTSPSPSPSPSPSTTPPISVYAVSSTTHHPEHPEQSEQSGSGDGSPLPTFDHVDTVSCRVPHRYNPMQPLSISVSFDDGLHFSTTMSTLSTVDPALQTKVPGTYFYTYPVVNRITPNAGTYFGGDEVHVYGSGFVQSALLQCRFGTQTVNYHAFIDDGHIVCVSPSRAVGNSTEVVPLPDNGQVHVEITNDALHFSDSAQIKQDGRKPLFNVFTSRVLPVINYVYPRFAARSGGTMLKVHGENFERSRYLRCLFSEANALGTWQNIALKGKTSTSSIYLNECVRNDVGWVDPNHGLDQWTTCPTQFLNQPHSLRAYDVLSPRSSVIHGNVNLISMNDTVLDYFQTQWSNGISNVTGGLTDHLTRQLLLSLHEVVKNEGGSNTTTVNVVNVVNVVLNQVQFSPALPATTEELWFEYSIHGLTSAEASHVASYISPRLKNRPFSTGHSSTGQGSDGGTGTTANNMTHYSCGGGGDGINAGSGKVSQDEMQLAGYNMQSGVAMTLQNTLNEWGCWNMGSDEKAQAHPHVRHVDATERPFLKNARGPSIAVDGNRNGFGEQYSSQTAPENEPWWEIDLGRNFTLEHIVVWLPTQPNEDNAPYRSVTEAPLWVLLATDTQFPLARNDDEGRAGMAGMAGMAGGTEEWLGNLEMSKRQTCGTLYCTKRLVNTTLIADEKGLRYVWNMSLDTTEEVTTPATNTSNATTVNVTTINAPRNARYIRIVMEPHVLHIPVITQDVVYCTNTTDNTTYECALSSANGSNTTTNTTTGGSGNGTNSSNDAGSGTVTYNALVLQQMLRLAEVEIFVQPTTSVAATFHSDKLVSCQIPPQEPSTRDLFASVQVFNQHHRPLEGSNLKHIALKQTPKVHKLSRQRVHLSGGMPIYLYGEGFVNTTDTNYDFSKASGHFTGPTSSDSAGIHSTYNSLPELGYGIRHLLGCSFGGIRVKATFVNRRQIICIVPARLLPSVVDVDVTVNGVDYTHDNIKLEYYSACNPGSYCPDMTVR